MHCNCRTGTSTTVDIHGPLETMGKTGCLENSVSTALLFEPVMNAHGRANVILWKLYVATIALLHKISEIGTVCDENVSRACAGHHLVYS